MALASLVPFQGPKKSRFSGPTPSNAPSIAVALLKTITYRAIKTTGTLVVLCTRVLLCAVVYCCCVVCCCLLLGVLVCCCVLERWGGLLVAMLHLLHPVRLAEFSVNFFYSVDSSLGRVPAYDACDPGSIPGGGNLNVCLQGPGS